MGEVSEALARLAPDTDSQLDRVFADHYPDLKRIARARLRSSGLAGSLQTTALVHDSYLKLAGGPARVFEGKLAFLAYASRTLRSIVIDIVREQKALRHGGDLERVTLDTEGGAAPADADIEAVNRALEDLAKLDAGLARLVEMRFFGGLTEIEVADALGVSERTVRREWAKARALLVTLLEG